MKTFLLLMTVFALLNFSCEKDQNNKLLAPYLRLQVNNATSSFAPADILNNNFFDCTIKGDTTLNIVVSKLYEGAGFNIKAQTLSDGTYTLDATNKAYYTNPKDYRRYTTNSSYRGTITIKRGTFQAKTLLNTLQGTFSFEAVDSTTNKTVKVLNGVFLMEVDVQ